MIVPVIETEGKLNGIRSVKFSPVHSTHVAIGGRVGGKIIDIRHLKQ